MDLKRAIMERISRRAYLDTPVEKLKLEQLEAAVWECNRAGDLNIKVVTDDPAPFGAKNTYGMISGAKNYLAMIKKVGDPDGDEKLGYYGESLVLLATGLGLGTCWLAGTYNKSECNVKVEDDEVLRCVIVFGNVKDRETLKEKAISKTVKRNSKEIKDLLLSDVMVPNWAVDGVRYALRAPSAQNRQPVRFVCSEDAVLAKVDESHENDLIDLGIAKLHFEIGAGGGTWEFGNKGIFTK